MLRERIVTRPEMVEEISKVLPDLPWERLVNCYEQTVNTQTFDNCPEKETIGVAEVDGE